MSKFHQFSTQLSAHDTIVAGYYQITSFYFLCFYFGNSSCKVVDSCLVLQLNGYISDEIFLLLLTKGLEFFLFFSDMSAVLRILYRLLVLLQVKVLC